MGGAGVDGDAAGRIEGPPEGVAVEHAHLQPQGAPGPQVAAGAGSQIGVDLEGGDAAAAPHLLRQDGGEVAGADSGLRVTAGGALARREFLAVRS